METYGIHAGGSHTLARSLQPDLIIMNGIIAMSHHIGHQVPIS